MCGSVQHSVCMVAYAILTALEPTLPEEEIQTHAFDAISISSVQKRRLFHVTAQALLKQGSNVVVFRVPTQFSKPNSMTFHHDFFHDFSMTFVSLFACVFK